MVHQRTSIHFGHRLGSESDRSLTLSEESRRKSFHRGVRKEQITSENISGWRYSPDWEPPPACLNSDWGIDLVSWDMATPYSLNRSNVLRNAPDHSGVYGLRRDEQWIYVGQSPNIQRGLLEYLSGHLPYVLQWQPNLFLFEVCPPRERVQRQRDLAQRYQPACNKKRLTARRAIVAGARR
jgi:hypothetical protein